MHYFRHKKGKGFYYTDQKGCKVMDPKLKAHFKSIVIPPAWDNVTINASPQAKIRATGFDAKGRKQYIYNTGFRQKQDSHKFDQIIHFAKQLEHMRRVTGQHLRKRKLNWAMNFRLRISAPEQERLLQQWHWMRWAPLKQTIKKR